MTRVPRERRPLAAPIPTAGEHRVTTFELFFDLVYVFAFTQVSQYMAATHSAIGVLQGLTILGLLWWSWSAYGWLANQTLADEGIVRFGMSVALIAVFVAALVIPESFDDLPGGLSGPLVFAVAYTVVRVLHMVLYFAASGNDAGLRRQVVVASSATVAGCGLLIAGAIVGGTAQTWLWLGGFALDVVLTFVTSRQQGDWRIQSPAHWAERFGLIIILALGESIVAIGVGVAQEPVSVAVIVGAVLSVSLSLLLWWLYFDVIADAAEERLAALDGYARASLAGEGYTYLHFGLVAGIILAALGVEEAMHEVAVGEAFGWFGAWSLFGGVALYLGAHGAFWRRAGGTWKVWRMSAGAVLLILVPIGASLPPLADLAIVVAVVGTLVVSEASRHRTARIALRARVHGA